MGNDLISVYIDRKRRSTIRYCSIFIKYLIDENIRLSKTLNSVVKIYYHDCYLKDDVDFEEISPYFSLDTVKDHTLRCCLLSCIRFYKANELEEKIVQDSRTIIMISNILYLALELNVLTEKYKDKSIQEWLPLYMKKYQNKIRLNEDKKQKDLENELISLWKKEDAAFHKFFKLLEDGQFQISVIPLLDYGNGYIVELNSDIKMLSRYSQSEARQVYEAKAFYQDEAIITLERLAFHYLKNLYIEDKYFLFIPIEVFENEKYYKEITKVTSNKRFKSRLVLTFPHHDIQKHKTTCEKLVKDNFEIGLCEFNEKDMKPEIFSLVKYVMSSPKSVQNHSKYYELWEDQNIRFVLYEEGQHE